MLKEGSESTVENEDVPGSKELETRLLSMRLCGALDLFSGLSMRDALVSSDGLFPAAVSRFMSCKEDDKIISLGIIKWNTLTI